MTFDSRDPRAEPTQWPCFGTHCPMKPQANAHGSWIHCGVCNLRLQYTPKKGSSSATTKTENPAMVSRMLQQLRPLMGEYKPNAAICLAMQKKIDAEETLMMAINKEVEIQNAPKGYPKAKASPSRASPTTTSPSSHWSVVDEGINPEDLDKHLTDAEKAQMQQILRERQAASREMDSNENEMA